MGRVTIGSMREISACIRAILKERPTLLRKWVCSPPIPCLICRIRGVLAHPGRKRVQQWLWSSIYLS